MTRSEYFPGVEIIVAGSIVQSHKENGLRKRKAWQEWQGRKSQFKVRMRLNHTLDFLLRIPQRTESRVSYVCNPTETF